MAESESKRLRVEASASGDVPLQEEEAYATGFGSGPISVQVHTPSLDAYGLRGETLSVSLPSIRATVSALKERVAALTGVPAGKQKLALGDARGVLKNAATLAHYNFGHGEAVLLSLKERGGRK